MILLCSIAFSLQLLSFLNFAVQDDVTLRQQVEVLAIYSRTVVRQFSYTYMYAGRTTLIPHHLLFTKHGAPTNGVNMSVNLLHTCLCRTTVIAGHFIDCYRL